MNKEAMIDRLVEEAEENPEQWQLLTAELLRDYLEGRTEAQIKEEFGIED